MSIPFSYQKKYFGQRALLGLHLFRAQGSANFQIPAKPVDNIAFFGVLELDFQLAVSKQPDTNYRKIVGSRSHHECEIKQCHVECEAQETNQGVQNAGQ